MVVFVDVAVVVVVVAYAIIDDVAQFPMLRSFTSFSILSGVLAIEKEMNIAQSHFILTCCLVKWIAFTLSLFVVCCVLWFSFHSKFAPTDVSLLVGISFISIVEFCLIFLENCILFIHGIRTTWISNWFNLDSWKLEFERDNRQEMLNSFRTAEIYLGDWSTINYNYMQCKQKFQSWGHYSIRYYTSLLLLLMLLVFMSWNWMERENKFSAHVLIHISSWK